MTRNGQADEPSAAHSELDDDEAFDESSGVPWWILALGLAVLVGALVIGLRVGNVLVGLVFPPEPPRPSVGQVEQVDYTREMHGADAWKYHITPATTCRIIEFYRGQGGACEVQPGYCTGEPDEDLQRRSALAATCSGEVPFSQFVMGWQAEIYDYDFYTQLNLAREIPWTRTRQD